MNKYSLAGIALIALGAGTFLYQGITYTSRNNAVDLGPIQVTTEQKKTIPIPPIVGGLVVAGGIGLLILSSRKS